MTVLNFDTTKGAYAFQFQEIDTAMHSHPAIELLFVEKGKVTLEITNRKFHYVSFAVIDANQSHKIYGQGELISIIMIEHQQKALRSFLKQFNVSLNEGFYIPHAHQRVSVSFEEVTNHVSITDPTLQYDHRINSVINFLNQNDIAYDQMIPQLTALVNLSESRLSHLFKQQMGLSLKKYLLWSKLKSTLKCHLDQKQALFPALIKSGFYDHPHFSRAFKTMLGVKPSKVYNSRTVQF